MVGWGEGEKKDNHPLRVGEKDDAGDIGFVEKPEFEVGSIVLYQLQ